MRLAQRQSARVDEISIREDGTPFENNDRAEEKDVRELTQDWVLDRSDDRSRS